MQIDYLELEKAAKDTQGVILIENLIKLLEDKWLAAYYDMSSHSPMVLEFPFNGFTYLFDQASANTSDVDDRAVAAYGISSKKYDRDQERQRQFLGPGGLSDIPGKGKFDRGHLIACSMGGGLDVNLFPQRPELNQGLLGPRKAYRKMESYAEEYPGTFVFSRLIYSDDSWVPSSIEYGILMRNGKLKVKCFAN